MNVWGIVVWWFTRGMIAWGAMIVMCIIALVEWYVKSSAYGEGMWDIVDKAMDEAPDRTKGKSVICKIMDVAVDFIIWPIRVIGFAVTFVKMLNRMDEMRNELYQE